MARPRKSAKTKEPQSPSPAAERQEKERQDLRKKLTALSKKASAISGELAELLKSKAVERHLVPDVDLGRAWEETLKPKLRTLCQPIEPRDWVSEGTELRVRLGRALGARVLRNLSFTEATLQRLQEVLAPQKTDEAKKKPKGGTTKPTKASKPKATPKARPKGAKPSRRAAKR